MTNENTEFANSTQYVYYDNGRNRFYISFVKYKKRKEKMISFQTSNKETYLKIKSELKQLGFKFQDSENSNVTTFLNYVKDKTYLTLATSNQEKIGNKNVSIYEISLSTK
jgi:hypothetical protein